MLALGYCSNIPHLQSSEDVMALFNEVGPGGQTPLGRKLDQLLGAYIQKLPPALEVDPSMSDDEEEIKPINILVITDGMPSKQP